MKIFILGILLLFSLTSCSEYEEPITRESLEIKIPQKITEERYYNGPLKYSIKQRDFDRKKKYWDSKIDSFYEKDN